MTDISQTSRSWKPIETAPEDRRAILCWAPDWERVLIVSRDGAYWDIQLSDQSATPTHWMPLPEPPL